MRDPDAPETPLSISSQEIVARRPSRNALDPRRPYAWLVEQECSAAGEVVDVATFFLTNRECPLRCLMCDLWKNTLTRSVSPGDIPEQIRWGLEQIRLSRRRVPGSESSGLESNPRQVKLYNSGNFFDRAAIPRSDHDAIADLVRGFDTVIVENHPKFCGDACFRFRDAIAPARLEIAMGLETCHEPTLRLLNKSMTLDDFTNAASRLHAGGIRTRVFLLQGLPLMSCDEATRWTLRSIDTAFDAGVSACSVIATRIGNGVMDDLLATGNFTLPTGASLEHVLEQGLAKHRGRVFVDLWDVDSFFRCDQCRRGRIERLRAMNLSQRVTSPMQCDACGCGGAR